MVKKLTANGSDESLNERMRAGRIWNAFEFINIQDAKVRLPLVIVLPENTYCLIFLTFFKGNVNLVSSVIVTAEEDPEP